jgi:hypothetical protein
MGSSQEFSSCITDKPEHPSISNKEIENNMVPAGAAAADVVDGSRHRYRDVPNCVSVEDA